MYDEYGRFIASLGSPYSLIAYLRRNSFIRKYFKGWIECNDYEVVEEFIETPYEAEYPFTPVLAFYDNEDGFTVEIRNPRALIARVPKVPGINWVPLAYDNPILFLPGSTLIIQPKPKTVLILRPKRKVIRNG